MRLSYIDLGDNNTYYWTGGGSYSQTWSSYSYPAGGVSVPGDEQLVLFRREIHRYRLDLGQQYNAEIYAVDNAGNTQSPGTIRSFIYDHNKPFAAIPAAAYGQGVQGPSLISGTAYDADSGVTRSS